MQGNLHSARLPYNNCYFISVMLERCRAYIYDRQHFSATEYIGDLTRVFIGH